MSPLYAQHLPFPLHLHAILDPSRVVGSRTLVIWKKRTTPPQRISNSPFSHSSETKRNPHSCDLVRPQDSHKPSTSSADAVLASSHSFSPAHLPLSRFPLSHLLFTCSLTCLPLQRTRQHPENYFLFRLRSIFFDCWPHKKKLTSTRIRLVVLFSTHSIHSFITQLCLAFVYLT